MACIRALAPGLLARCRLVGNILRGGVREGKAGRLLEAESERIRHIVWGKVLAELGIDDGPLITRLSEASRSEGTGSHDPYPGVRESLAHLADRFPLGLVTNGNSDIQRRKLARSGLEEYFKTVVVSGDVGLQTLKPDPAPFERALKSIGANPQNAVMVGNDPVNDIQGAASLGMKTIWVNMALASFDTPGKPDHEINHMSEVPSVIGMLS